MEVNVPFITFEQYQQSTKTTAIYPDAGKQGSLQSLSYCALGLAGEAGEIANKVKKLLRDGDSFSKRDAIAAELGDVLWYLSQLATELEKDLGKIA